MKILTPSQLVTGIKWLFYLLAALIVGVLLINLFDQHLHPDIPAFADFSSEGVPPEQNAYFALMGQAAALGSDPHALGMELVKQVNQLVDQGKGNDPVSMEIPDKLYGPGKIQLRGAITTLCERDAHRCLPAYRQKAQQIAQMLRDNQVLIARTYRLYHYPHYRETMQQTIAAPFPMYGTLGSDLILAKIGLQATRGEQLPALEALEQEVRFWRMVLRESRMLITKMVAVARLKRSFRLTSEIMATYPPNSAQTAILMRILAPLGAEELNMARTFRSEFVFTKTILEDISATDMADAGKELTTWKLTGLFLFKRNATINLIYARDRDLAALGILPADEFLKQAIQIQAHAAQRPHWRSWHFAYNPVGKILGEIAIPDYVQYIARIHNLDGLLRLVKLQLLMQQRAIPNTQGADFLAKTDPALTNPYTQQPMEWDPALHVLYFQGMQDRGDGELLGQRVEVRL